MRQPMYARIFRCVRLRKDTVHLAAKLGGVAVYLIFRFKKADGNRRLFCFASEIIPLPELQRGKWTRKRHRTGKLPCQ